MITLTNKIDMAVGGLPPVIHMGQYDSDFSLVFELYSSSGEFDLQTNTTAEIRGTKTDGNGYSANATIDITNKKVTITGDVQMTAAAGRNVYELVLKRSNKELSSTNFVLDVEHAALDRDTIPSESKIKELINVIDRTDELIAAADLIDADKRATQTYRNEAQGYATAASTSATNAASSASSANTSKNQAATSASNAASSENTASTKASQALTSANNAANSATNASNNATLSRSYAVGGTGTRTGENTDNAKYYKEQAASSATNAANSASAASTSKTNAASSATAAARSASAASASAQNAAEIEQALEEALEEGIEPIVIDYLEHHPAAVSSVNGKSGNVTLTAGDVGAYTKSEVDAIVGNIETLLAAI